jgi:nucleoside-diphosphate-sugar epimerase
MRKDNSLKILVTGANGFIGRSLCATLKEKGYFVRGAVRNNMRDVPGVDEYAQVGDIDGSTAWRQALGGIDVVVHLAGRAHVLKDSAANPIESFRKVNVLGTERLARSCVEAGVKRFIFISSVKADGDDAYGVSKREAENSLACIAKETGLEVVILRLPLVYGPGVKANFKNLIKLAISGLPLPFKGINNRRSFLYLGNLVDAISVCIIHPLAAGETFLVSDGQDVSTPELIRMVAGAMGKRVVLFHLHFGILKTLCRIVGKAGELEKLTGSLVVDSSKIRNLLGWKPPFTLEEGIRETVKLLRK